MISRRSLVLAGTSLPLVAAAPFAFAQPTTFPRRPVLWVVPYPAGGFGDAVSRVLAQHMASTLKQPVVVENKPGAGDKLRQPMSSSSPRMVIPCCTAISARLP